MSDKLQTQPIAGKAPPPAPPANRTMVWLIGGLAFLAALAIGLGSPTLLVFMLIAFAPTIAAGMIDKDVEKHSAIAVGAMSLAAIIPLTLGQLTARPGSGYSVLSDPFAWLMVYGAAGVGWAIHMAVPAMFVAASNFRAECKREELKKLQESLAEEWGQEVVTRKK